MRDDFYHAFEERFRGSRESILERLRVYLPFVEPLRKVEDKARVLDLGCGRGEWLELMDASGLAADGVDLDPHMVEACCRRGLSARLGEAVAHLGDLGDQSRTLITAFHLVEHLPFEQVCAMVSEALRVLTPGGLLILETPNPENFVVATRDFYLDPTHQRPLPPPLLAFLTEYGGFVRIQVLRLQESKALERNPSPSLNDVLGGASPDYAVVAQKAAPADALALFDQAFDQDLGLLGHTLADRYDGAILNRERRAGEALRQVEEAVHQLQDTLRTTQTQAGQAWNEARAAQAQAEQACNEARAAQAQAEVARNESRAAQAQAEQACNEARAAQAQAEVARNEARAAQTRAGQAEDALAAIYRSRSWRLTAPLRFLSLSVSRGNLRLRTTLRRGLETGYHLLNRNPSLKQRILRSVAVFPSLEARLRRALYRQIFGGAFRPEDPPPRRPSVVSAEGLAETGAKALQDALSPRERQIFRDLKNAFQSVAPEE